MLKKIFTFGIIVLLVGMSIPSTGINVDKASITSFNGNTLYVGGDGPGNYTKIQDAINDSSDGDTVFVYNGIYVENIVVDKPITLIGEDKNFTVIDGKETGDVLHLTTNNISINFFTIKNGGNLSRDAGIDIRSDLATIKSNILIDNRVGIYLDDADNNIIMDNIILNSSEYGQYSGDGIWLSHSSDNNTVANNAIFNGDYHGIAVSYSRDNNLSQNTIMNNEEGINLYKATNNILYLNNITNHSHEAIQVVYSGNNSIIGNNIFDNDNDGLEIWGSNGTTIYENKILNNNYYGIDIKESSFDINVFNNTIINCWHGIFEDDSSNLTIAKNYIMNCTLNGISIYGSMWNGAGHVISENIISYNGDEGIMLAGDTPNNIISENNFIGNKRGVTIGRDTYNNMIFENNFLNNYDYGILILPTGKTNYVYHNNFINNSKHAYGGPYNVWDDDYPSGGNYWDNYSGIDENKDGIGDTPYSVPDNNEDQYPFMEPIGWNINYPPIVDRFEGSNYGQPGIPIWFTVGLFDPDGDYWYFMIDWGDDSYTDWIGPYAYDEWISKWHTWSEGTYHVRVKGKDVHGAESNWSEPIELVIESEPPIIDICKPDKALYVFNRKIFPRLLRQPLIIGNIDITVETYDHYSGIDKVEFYINNKLKSVDNSSPYTFSWKRDRLRFFHYHVLKVIVYDNCGNIANDKIIVRRLL